MGKHLPFVILATFFVIFGIVVIQQNQQQKLSTDTTAANSTLEGFPDFPVPPGGVLERSNKKEEGSKFGYELVYEIPGSPQEAITWYKEELTRQGWEVYDEAIEEIVNDLYIRARRENEMVNVFSETEDGKTELTVEYPLQ